MLTQGHVRHSLTYTELEATTGRGSNLRRFHPQESLRSSWGLALPVDRNSICIQDKARRPRSESRRNRAPAFPQAGSAVSPPRSAPARRAGFIGIRRFFLEKSVLSRYFVRIGPSNARSDPARKRHRSSSFQAWQLVFARLHGMLGTRRTPMLVPAKDAQIRNERPLQNGPSHVADSASADRNHRAVRPLPGNPCVSRTSAVMQAASRQQMGCTGKQSPPSSRYSTAPAPRRASEVRP